MKKRDILWLVLGAGMVVYGDSTAVQSGNWNDAATWNNGVPTASDKAFINGGQAVTVQAATTNATAKQIYLGAGGVGTLTVNGDFTGGDWNAIVLGTWNNGNGNGTLNIDGGTVGSMSARQKITMGEAAAAGTNNYNRGTIQISSGGSLYAKETRLFATTGMLGTNRIDVLGGTLNADGFRLYIGDQSGSADTARLEVGGVSTVSMGSLWLGNIDYDTSGRLVVNGSDVAFSMTGGCTMRRGSVLDFNFDADGISAIHADAFWYPLGNVVTANVHGVAGVAPGRYDLLVGNQIGSGGDRDIVFNVSGFGGAEVELVKDTTSGLVYYMDIRSESNIDGVPVSWIIHYFSTTNGFSGAADPDSDAMSNQEEYLADTDPTDPDSLLKVLGLTGSSTNMAVMYQNGGSNASVFVEYRAGVYDGWKGVFTNAAPTSQTNTYLHSNMDTDGWYRLRAQRP